MVSSEPINFGVSSGIVSGDSLWFLLNHVFATLLLGNDKTRWLLSNSGYRGNHRHHLAPTWFTKGVILHVTAAAFRLRVALSGPNFHDVPHNCFRSSFGVREKVTRINVTLVRCANVPNQDYTPKVLRFTNYWDLVLITCTGIFSFPIEHVYIHAYNTNSVAIWELTNY